MNCEKCGKPISVNSNYCPTCGHRNQSTQNIGDSSAVSKNQAAVSAQSTDVHKLRSGGKKILLISASIIGVAIMGTVFWYATLPTFQDGKAAFDKKDYTSALAILEPLASKRDVEAQYLLADMYGNGNGVDKNYKKAISLLQISAEAGYIKSQYKLGYLTYQNRDDAYDLAGYWFEKAAEQGHGKAAYFLGYMYSYGYLPATGSVEKAKYWYKKAAEKGCTRDYSKSLENGTCPNQ